MSGERRAKRKEKRKELMGAKVFEKTYFDSSLSALS
jgi:hypothetical protein